MAKQYKNYVNGEWKTSENEITIYAPANGEELGSVPAMSQAEVDEVYAAAKQHFQHGVRFHMLNVQLTFIKQQISWNVMQKRSVKFFLKKSLKV